VDELADVDEDGLGEGFGLVDVGVDARVEVVGFGWGHGWLPDFETSVRRER
jgi:hypothetical protein